MDCAHGIPMGLICGACVADHKPDIADTLAERGKNYGSFDSHAEYSQDLKNIMRQSPNWKTMAADQREALEMVQHKIGRILNGNPNFHDSWHDIVGYAKLVADRLAK